MSTSSRYHWPRRHLFTSLAALAQKAHDANMTELNDMRRAILDDSTRPDAPAALADDMSPDASGAPVVLQVEAAKRSGVSVRTIQRAIQRGELTAQRQDRKCWIRLADLEHWRARHAPPVALSHTTVRDIDASVVATGDTLPDASRRAISGQTRDTHEIERLRKEVVDARAERDRWHEAFLRESEHRIEETRQLRQLLQQEQALSFSRVQALEATSRHDTTAHDAPPESPQDTVVLPASRDASSGALTIDERPWWRRALGIR